jgi:dGTPase
MTHSPPSSAGVEYFAARTGRWAASRGTTTGSLVTAHAPLTVGPVARPTDRVAREQAGASMHAPGATRAAGGGRRRIPEPADPWRTCFERDRDRILHSTAFRRLAGKTQVFIFPSDHQRTRLTHALEVAQVATAIARACGLDEALTGAIALGHDCGHGPGGHASEHALGPYLPTGYDHAVWGADVVLAPLNLCEETLDGIRNHSWSRPAPATPEGEVVAWADRIAYVCHDFEDAVHAGVVSPDELPTEVADRCGRRHSRQLDTFISAVVTTALTEGVIAMPVDVADALDAFRRFNYQRIYTRPASLDQAERTTALLRALVDRLVDEPRLLPHGDVLTTEARSPVPGVDPVVAAAVTYVAGMTDRYACQFAIRELGWSYDQLPRGIDLFG